MASIVLGTIVAVLLFFALRHVYRNVKAGKEDCCGSSGCSSCSICGGSGCSACCGDAEKKK